MRYVQLDQLLAQSDIITLHCPLTPKEQDIINAAAIAKMKTGVMLINTSRRALLDTVAVFEPKERQDRLSRSDLYEEEEQIFFEIAPV